MPYCRNCGAEINEKADVCINCGYAINKAPSESSKISLGWGAVGFFLPPVGLILWLIWINKYPRRSKSAGLGALLFIILLILRIAVYFFTLFMTFGLIGIFN